jgi:hypothetical protein
MEKIVADFKVLCVRIASLRCVWYTLPTGCICKLERCRLCKIMQSVSIIAYLRTEVLTGALSYCKLAAAHNLKTAFSCCSVFGNCVSETVIAWTEI